MPSRGQLQHADVPVGAENPDIACDERTQSNKGADWSCWAISVPWPDVRRCLGDDVVHGQPAFARTVRGRSIRSHGTSLPAGWR